MDIDLTPIFKAQEGRSLESGYRLQRYIGRGTFGAVYRGGKELAGSRIDRVDAVKLILPQGSPDFRRRQLDELLKLPGLEHPHIIRCRDVYECDTLDGRGAFPATSVLTLVMELAQDSLEDRLNSLRTENPGSPTRLALARQVGSHIAQALAWLDERKRMVHQDLKPGNVLRVIQDGEEVWKLSDFGLVSTVEEGSYRRSDWTRGTLVYMPPEAFPSRDHPKVIVSPKWDVWSLGCTLAEILSGRLAFSGNSEGEATEKIWRGRPDVPPSSLPAPFDRVVAGCLEADRKKRWTAQQVVDALTERVKPETVPAPERPVRPAPSSPNATGSTSRSAGWLGALGVMIILGGISLLVWRHDVSEEKRIQEVRQQNWSAWQSRMKQAFDAAAAVTGTAANRRQAWDRFLAEYAEDNPLSTDDHWLRIEAQKRRQAIVDEKTGGTLSGADWADLNALIEAAGRQGAGGSSGLTSSETDRLHGWSIDIGTEQKLDIATKYANTEREDIISAKLARPYITVKIKEVKFNSASYFKKTIVGMSEYEARGVCKRIISSGGICNLRQPEGSSPSAPPPPPGVVVVSGQWMQPGSVFRDAPGLPEMVVIPAGSFWMNAPDDDESGNRRKHLVTIDNQFALGKFDVTFAQWDACVADGGCKGYRPGDEGWGRGTQPVINVSTEDANNYASWISNKTGKHYRLPTEIEWEYAAKAGTTTRYYTGETINQNQANFDKDKTTPVGNFPPNPFGLYDMVGNVYQLLAGCVRGGEAFTEPCGAPGKGGSWVFDSGNRTPGTDALIGLGQRESFIGFRLARTLP
ncbi:bifunctional serine/threonine-protein kinase/formylglycine-generating enzyme family protein [Magnetospirillum sp. 15-1]|uniref:bifunctional serine/threonine-protein kinase/formylglycine-generating enzyme family protein n=1 Tax=Magnetospirillum sp. 15-1 TaxID=1979370 RepID=UPI000BBCAD51|nr:bifunctional serine/threonine-protein kinase/formylglycine-generating enzyme family protein [Magnetospirillum sp. 15-1]